MTAPRLTLIMLAMLVEYSSCKYFLIRTATGGKEKSLNQTAGGDVDDVTRGVDESVAGADGVDTEAGSDYSEHEYYGEYEDFIDYGDYQYYYCDYKYGRTLRHNGKQPDNSISFLPDAASTTVNCNLNQG